MVFLKLVIAWYYGLGDRSSLCHSHLVSYLTCRIFHININDDQKVRISEDRESFVKKWSLHMREKQDSK